MDILLDTVNQHGRDVVVLSMHGLERSRFFLRFSLNLFAKKPHAKIYHVLDSDRLVARVQNEAALMPFSHFGPVGVNLIICSIKSLYETMPESAEEDIDFNATNVIIYDVTSLDSLEGTIIELKGDRLTTVGPENLIYDIRLRYKVTSTILACNGPLDGLEADLGIHYDPNIITYNCLQAHQEGSASFGNGAMWPHKDNDRPIELDDEDASNRARLHRHVGQMLEKLASSPSSGRIVVFFPTYGKMVEFHNAWKQTGVFDRIGITYARENRGGDNFKNALKDLAARDRSIFLCSIRYHQDEDLAEMVLGQVENFVIVGLPYPIMSDTWKARIKRHNVQSKTQDFREPKTISGSKFYKCRAVDFMNGIIKRCLFNGYRSKPCHFLILGEENMGIFYRYKLVKELGDVQEWPRNLKDFNSVPILSQPTGAPTDSTHIII